MKRICVFCMLLSFSGFGQSSVKSILLKVTSGKTTTLIFPFAIKQVDRGISSLLVQKSGGLENVLLVKAARPNLPETNLTVFTSDGKLYPFIVQYAADPEILNYSFIDSMQNPVVNDASLKEDAGLAAKQKSFLHRSFRAYKMVFILRGIYLKDHVLWLCMRTTNKSVIDYDLAGWRCFIRSKSQSKRTAVQEVDKVPVYQSVLSPVPGHRSQDYIIGFPVFTIADAQELVIESLEQAGERILKLRIGAAKLLRARIIQ